MSEKQLLSKEEILEKNNAGGYVTDKRYRQLFGKRQYLYNAMEEYASQQSIAFMKWANTEGWQQYDGYDRMIHFESRKVLEVKNLYEEFKNKQ